jgi:hypothetical protein
VIGHCWDCGLARNDLAFTELAPRLQLLCGDCRHNRSAYETELEGRACAICGRQPINRPGWQVTICSAHCNRERHNRRRRLRDRGERVCAAPGCDFKLYAARSDKLFCSPACQKRARRKLGRVAVWQSRTFSAEEPF